MLCACNSGSNETVTVGVLTPFTGPITTFGDEIKNGIILAQEDLSVENIELVFEDSRCDPKTAVTSYKNLVGKGAEIIIGTVCSGSTEAIAGLAQEQGIYLVSTLAATPSISNGRSYVYRLYPASDVDAQAMITFIAQEQKQRVAVLYVANDYGAHVANYLREGLGNLIVMEESYLPGTSPDASQLLKIQQSNADIVLAISYPSEFPTIIKTAQELGFAIPIIGSQATTSAKVPLSEHVRKSKVVLNQERYTVFSKDYADKFGYAPSYPAEFGYDTFLAVGNAVGAAQGKNEFIGKYLSENVLQGISGSIAFDDNGNRIGAKIVVP